MLLRLPNIPLRLNATTGSMATAYEPVDLSKLCTWQVEDGAGALGNATYHLSIFVDEPLACSKVVFDDCTSRPQPCTAMAQSQVQSTVSTERGYEVLHLYSPSLEALRFHLTNSMVFEPCNCTEMERFECVQTIFAAMERFERSSLAVDAMAETTCLVHLQSPLTIFAALRGPPLKPLAMLQSPCGCRGWRRISPSLWRNGSTSKVIALVPSGAPSRQSRGVSTQRAAA